MKTIEFNDIFDLTSKVVEEANAMNEAGEEVGVTIVVTDCKKVKSIMAGTDNSILNSLLCSMSSAKSERLSSMLRTAVLMDADAKLKQSSKTQGD